LIGVAGGMLIMTAKKTGKLRYFRNVILYFLCRVHWIRGKTAPARKEKTRP
jgi:hypothetical protein